MNSILLIEDDAIVGESLVERLELEGFKVKWARSLADATLRINKSYACIICDVRLPDGSGTQWFAELSTKARAIPWFFLTGYGCLNDAIAAIKAGAKEYLTKPFDIEKLVEMVRGAAANESQPEETVVLGVSPAMRHVEELVKKVAPQRVSVLLSGESGVGKEVAANLIHQLDTRPGKREFIAVNCAAIPETLLEAEFFGFEKGAFSGAVRQHKGYLERADQGTLFLDEVGELPASMQAKLLRALQEKCFFRLGSEKITKSDFRIIAASNRDLYADMNAGIFREDLFYRLAVIRIALPPLRERPEDIRWLAQSLLTNLMIEQGRQLTMSESFLRDIMLREWRGNVRELRSYLEHAVVMSEGGVLHEPFKPEIPKKEVAIETSDEIVPLHAKVEEAERAHILKALIHCEGRFAKAAELLSISRKTLWEKMKRLEISI